ncbi:MAG: ArsR family transcriptional regulator [Halobacteria archaeon]
MDSSKMLDVLGNENRRRILELLSRKPCYVTEISDYIGVSPKAVIDHLEVLDEGGLIESRVDDKRRKYFYISRNLRMEVQISPYYFDVKSAYPNDGFSQDYQHLEIDGCKADDPESMEFEELREEFAELEKIGNELSLAQRQVQSRINQVLSEIEERMETEVDTEIQVEVLLTLIESPLRASRLAEQTDVNRETIVKHLKKMEQQGFLVEQDLE